MMCRVFIFLLNVVLVWLISSIFVDSSPSTIIHVYPNTEEADRAKQKTNFSSCSSNRNTIIVGSIFEARDFIRRADFSRSNKGDNITIIVELREGVHYLNRTFELDARDAVGSEKRILYRSYKNERVVISGGKEIDTKSFRPFSGNIVQVNLFDVLNISKEEDFFGSLSNPYPKNMMELFYNSKPMTLARDPNIMNNTWIWAGYETMKPINDKSFVFSDEQRGHLWKSALGNNDSDDSDDSDDYSNSSKKSEVWLHGYFKFDWRDTYVKLESIDEFYFSNNRSKYYKVTRSSHTKPWYHPWIEGCRFYAINSLQLLDSPGEYFLDRNSGMLYFYPPNNKPLSVYDNITVSFLQNAITASTGGANNVSFIDLRIEYTRGTAVAIKNGVNTLIKNVTIGNSGGGCLSILKGNNTYIVNSKLFNCGEYGIKLSGGNIKTLETSHIYVVNNTITNYARISRTYQPGVLFHGVGIYVANNIISDGPHTGITGDGVNNVFEYNMIKNVSYECTDTGAFYTGRSWAQRGNIARFNEFNNIRAKERLSQKTNSQVAFYLDDQMSGWDFYGNKVKNSNLGILIGGGRHNRVHNNYFENNDVDIAFDNRGMTWQNKFCQKVCDLSIRGTTKCFYDALHDVNYTFSPYATSFPEIVDVYDYHPCFPVGNAIEDNIYCHRSNNTRAFISARESQSRETFINRNNSVIKQWFSSISNNREYCLNDDDLLFYSSLFASAYILR